MKQLFIPFALALLAKEKGFDEPCFAHFMEYEGGHSFSISTSPARNSEVPRCYIMAPLYQQIIDFFREKHDFEIYAIKQIEEDEYGGIVGWIGVEDYESKICKPTYYEALTAAIEHAFTLI